MTTAKLQQRQATLINLITRVGGRQNIQKWMDELLQIDVKLEEVKQMETLNFDHVIWCEMDQNQIEQLASILKCQFEKSALLLTAEQFAEVKAWKFKKLKEVSKQINFDDTYCSLKDCFEFEGKIKTEEEKNIEKKIKEISNMNAEKLSSLIKSLGFPWEAVHIMPRNSDVVTILITNPRKISTDFIESVLAENYIPFETRGNEILASGKLRWIKDQEQRLHNENKNKAWYTTDRNVRDSM